MHIFLMEKKYKYYDITWYLTNNMEELVFNKKELLKTKISKRELIQISIEEYLSSTYKLDINKILVIKHYRGE